MSKNLYFVSSNSYYNRYAIMCINSIIRNTNTDVVWMQMNYVDKHIQSDKLTYINVETSSYKHIYDIYQKFRGQQINDRQIFTSARFIELDKIIQSGLYDNICLLDADMLIINNKMDNFFDLINDSKYLITANENFKWVIDDCYTLNNKPIFDQPTRLLHFGCSVPLFFNCKYMKDFVKEFLNIFLKGKQKQPGENERDIDDMFAYNITLQKMGKANNMILFPAEIFTQTHMDGYLPWNPMIKIEEGIFIDSQYLEVYSFHGRIIDQSYKDMIIYEVRKRMGQLDYNTKEIDNYMFRLNCVLRMVEQEFLKYAK